MGEGVPGVTRHGHQCTTPPATPLIAPRLRGAAAHHAGLPRGSGGAALSLSSGNTRSSALNLKADDFGWVTRKLMDLADKTAGGRVVSVLEGGYDLQGLQESVEAHVTALMGG